MLKFLNCEHKTSGIIRRISPESGVDLFYPLNKTAYQCKSIESGFTGGFNSTRVKDSYRAALSVKSSLGWDKYFLY